MTAIQIPSRSELSDFVYREAHLLDTQQYEQWYELFADDGVYWVPMSDTQTDWRQQQSLTIEDKLLLKVRVARLRESRNYGMHPGVRSQHVLQAPAVEEADSAANRYRLRTPLFYTEARGEKQTVLTGVLRHTLRAQRGQLAIVEKRVDLLNAAAALPPIFLIP